MPRFHFKLQKVLEARQSFEDLAKREFGDALRELYRQESMRDELLKEREELLLEMGNRRSLKSTAESFARDIQYEWNLHQRIKAQSRRVEEARGELEKKRKKLIEAVKDRKIMEKLREKRWEEFRKKMNIEEFKFADEIAGRRAHFEHQSISGE